LLLHGALVVLLLALRKADGELRAPLAPVELERHEGVAAPLDEARQPVDLVPVQQQAPGSGGIGIDVRRRREEGGDVRAEEPRLVVPKHYVGFRQLRFAGAQALHFPSLQLEARLEILLDEIVEARLSILGDRALRVLLSLLPGHRSAMILECKTKNTL